tara:strand:- start:144 stop:389 length:246 start_codon:yes stop_codon:yes gene_type:complete
MYKIVLWAIALFLIYLVMDSTGNKLYSLGTANPSNYVTYYFGQNKVVISGVILVGAYFLIRYIRSDPTPYDEDEYAQQFRY